MRRLSTAGTTATALCTYTLPCTGACAAPRSSIRPGLELGDAQMRGRRWNNEGGAVAPPCPVPEGVGIRWISAGRLLASHKTVWQR